MRSSQLPFEAPECEEFSGVGSTPTPLFFAQPEPQQNNPTAPSRRRFHWAAQMANDSLLITKLPDGTFHVKETEPADEASGEADQPIDQSVQSPDDAMSLVQQWLQEEGSEDEDAADGGADDASEGDAGAADDGSDMGSGAPAPAPKAAWNAEAKKRDPVSGLRK